MVQQYFREVERAVLRVATTQAEAIDKVSERIAQSIVRGGIWHIFGSGHSHMIAEEAFHRAGGLACVDAMLEPSLMEVNVGRATLLERLSGLADVLMEGYSWNEHDVLMVVSHSGINPVPIEVALNGKRRGLYVVGLTALDHTHKVHSRHSSGRRLMDVVDDVIDSCGAFGDASVPVPGFDLRVGPTSTILGTLIVNALTVAVVERLAASGVQPPVFVSGNTENGDRHNRALVDAYRARIRYL